MGNRCNQVTTRDVCFYLSGWPSRYPDQVSIRFPRLCLPTLSKKGFIIFAWTKNYFSAIKTRKLFCRKWKSSAKRKGCSATAIVSSTICLLVLFIAAAAGPVPIKLFIPSERLVYRKGQDTVVLYIRLNPIFSKILSILPSSESANGPGVPRGGVGNKAPIDFRTWVASLFSGLSQIATTSRPPGFNTLPASFRAFLKFPAYWNELNPATTWKLSSAKGNASRSSSRKLF